MVGLTFLGLFSAIFFAYYFYLKFRHKERTMLIEKNVDIADFYKQAYQKSQIRKGFPWYMIGFTLLGFGIGIGAAQILVLIIDSNFVYRHSAPLFGSLTMIFGALGIILGHNFERKKSELRG